MKSYTFKPAIKEAMPLLIGLIGPTWTGKTYSSLRLATGIVKARGGKIVGIDTEARRMLQYADDFAFLHLDFGGPFSSLRYAEAIAAAVEEAHGGCVIVDSMSHEHEGVGGYLDYHEQEVQRLIQSGGFKNEYSANIPAWNKPSGARRKLINTVLQFNCAFIFDFRAKEKIKPVTGQAPRDLGWQAIAGEELGFEMSVRCLLTPGCKGTPDWSEDAQKLGVPKRIKDHEAILKEGRQLDEHVGFELAQWAVGGTAHVGGVIDKGTSVKSTLGDSVLPPTPDRSADLAIVKADYDRRLREAKTFKEAVAVRDELRDSDMPADYKTAFELAFRQKFEERKK